MRQHAATDRKKNIAWNGCKLMFNMYQYVVILFRGLLYSRPVFWIFLAHLPKRRRQVPSGPSKKNPVLPQKHKAQSKPRSLKRGIRSNFGKSQDAFPQCWHVIYTTWIHMKHSQSIQRKVNPSRFFAVIFTWQGRKFRSWPIQALRCTWQTLHPSVRKKTIARDQWLHWN